MGVCIWSSFVLFFFFPPPFDEEGSICTDVGSGERERNGEERGEEGGDGWREDTGEEEDGRDVLEDIKDEEEMGWGVI